jgi:hypothetical protein
MQLITSSVVINQGFRIRQKREGTNKLEDFVTVMLTLPLAVVELNVTEELGLKLQLVPDGSVLQERVTVPLNPFTAVTTTGIVAGEELDTVTLEVDVER